MKSLEDSSHHSPKFDNSLTTHLPLALAVEVQLDATESASNLGSSGSSQ